MFEALNYFVEKLIRLRIGNIELGSVLRRGEIRPLMRTEMIKLKRAVGLQDNRSEPERPGRERRAGFCR